VSRFGRRLRASLLLALVVASLTVMPDPADAQVNAIAVSTAPAFPSAVTVGAQNQPGLLALTNNSVGNLSTQPVTITNIRLNPSCVSAGTAVGTEPCTQPEPRAVPGPIFNIDPIATGRAGTACAGILFAVSPANANGTVTFTPTAPVILAPVTTGGPTTTCIIDFTFDVAQRPLDGGTFAVAFVDAAAPNPTPPPAVIPAFNIPGTSSIIVVNEAPTTIVTQASPQSLTAGGLFSDTATVTGVPGGPPLTDSVTFTLFRSLPGNPGFPTCTPAELVATANNVVQVVAGPNAPNGAPTATATFTPIPVQPAGRYVFVATYDPPGGPNPDINYLSSTSACGDPLEQVTVAPLLPSITVEKSANPTVVNEPGGPVVFTVRVINTGPNPLTLTSLMDNVYGNLNGQGSCAVAPPGSLPPTPPLLAANGGDYTCSFTAPVPPVGAGQAGQSFTDVVTAIGVDAAGNTATDFDDAVVTIVGVPPVITVIKDASPLTRPEPGGTFTFTVRVRNDSPAESVTITTLTDNIYGNLATRPGSTCGALIGTVLAPGATSAPCSFTGPFNGSAGATQTDIVTATAVDDDGQTATDTDDAIVGITDVLPTVRVVKTANPTNLPAPGGTFTFSAVVTNTSAEPITITALNDNIYGNLATIPGSTCGALIGTTLAPGASSPTCTFPGAFTGAAGAVQTDVVTVTATDDEGNVVTDDDDATVTLTSAPSILVEKSAEPSSLPEPGGTFTFSVRVTNTSPETITITGLTDDIYGNIATRPGSTCGALIGTTLAPGASSPVCTFTGPFNGPAGASQTDIVTATGQNSAGTVVTDTDDAIVRITNVVPVIDVDKQAIPLTLPAPGGTFTFLVTVRNPSAEPITITALTDDIYGDLATRPGSDCGTLIGTTLAPGTSSAPCTFLGTFTGPAGASQTDVVTVTGTDASGTVVTADDDATVTLINVVPDISVVKSATPSSRPAPGGAFTFDVVVTNTGPSPLTITSLTDDIYGDVTTIPGSTCSTAIGTVLPSGVSFSCSFTGNFTGVGGAAQTDVVTVTGTDAAGVVVTDNDDATVTLTSVFPTVRVDKTAAPFSLPEPGGAFTFTAVVTNTGTVPVTITSLTDDIYGNLATRPGSTCGALIGTTLAPGASSAPCTFPGNFIGDAGATQTDVVTVVVSGPGGTTATDDDDATVIITNAPPTITLVKTATPLSRPAPGGTFTFNVVVTNTSFEPLTITSLVDNVYGSLNGQGTCAIGATLAPNGGTYTCSFDGPFNGAPNASQTDIVTVLAVDNDGTTVTASDDATVTLIGTLPTLTTQVSAGSVGASVFDTATLAGGFNPTGTITFQLYGPNPANDPNPADNCSGAPIFTNVKPVTGATDPRIVLSDGFILPSPGVYHFVATYSGDANNPAVGPTACLDPNETIGVGRLPISLTTTASPSVSLGGSIFDTATIAGGFNPTGNVTFNVFGPGNATCTGTPVFTSVKPVNGNGTYTSDPFTPTAPGVYRFVASYSGDANNASTITACDDPLEQVTVSLLPVIRVDKTAVPESLPAPGGDAVFNVVVTNTSNVALTIRSLTDNVYGNVTTLPGSTCNTAIGTVLAPAPGPGNTYTCRFVGAVTGASGSTHTDVVTVTATDSRGNTVRDDDDAVVTITGVTPTITSTKVATPTSMPEPGGSFSFTFTVTNTGPEPVTVTSLVDNIYGDLNGRGTCAIGAVLARGATYTCTFSGNFFGNAGSGQTDTITVTVRDNAGTTVTSQSSATVTLVNVPPTIGVTKSPDPVSRPEPGGSFRFTVTVTNTSFEPVTINSLVDDIYGDLNGRGSCAIGVRLAANGGSYSCAFDGEFRGVSGASQTDTVTVVAVDDDNTSVTAAARATVSLTPPGTPPVTPPPTTPPVTPPPATPPVQPPLPRTGSDLSGPARLAGLLLIVGMTLIAATRRFGNGGPGLAPVPIGPGPRGGPRSGGARGMGSTGRGSGLGVVARPRPPRRPLDGLRPPTGEGAVSRKAPAPEADRAWADSVAVREPIVTAPTEAAAPEAVVPTVVQFRPTGALDGAALDAAQALTRPVPAAAPSRRRSPKHGRR